MDHFELPQKGREHFPLKRPISKDFLKSTKIVKNAWKEISMSIQESNYFLDN